MKDFFGAVIFVLAPASTLLYTKSYLLKRTKVIIRVEVLFSSDYVIVLV
jgi:hypothetical protein